MRDLHTSYAAAMLLTLVAVSCAEKKRSASFEKRHLEPAESTFVEERSSKAAPQPPRKKPRTVVYAPERRRVYVALQGSIDEPAETVVAVDAKSKSVVERYQVGRSPTGLALHPSGRWLVVSNRYSNFLSIIDLERGRVRAHQSDFYVRQLAFAPSGDRLYATNRWRDTLQIWDVDRRDSQLRLRRRKPDDHRHGLPVGSNPKDLAVTPDGSQVWVASPANLTVSAFDARTLEALDLRPSEPENSLYLASPPNDLALHENLLYIPTLSAGSGHPHDAGPDTDGDGRPGDNTPNTQFNDVQNEIAVYEKSGQPRTRYTSDTICCRDIDDVAPSDPELGEQLPDRDQWIVEGAFPESAEFVDIGGHTFLLVVYAGSNELQKFRVDKRGRLRPGPVLSTEFQPTGLAVDDERNTAYVTNRLSESLLVVDLQSFEVRKTLVVGDTSKGAFPTTDVEIGELFYFSGAAFSVDGDITCNHCHPRRGALGKTFGMPLLADDRGTRNTPDTRGLFTSQPWFFEGAMENGNFDREINRAAKKENFCCADAPDRDACVSDPPSSCEDRPFPSNFPTRDAFFLHQADQLLERRKSFGDSDDATALHRDGLTQMLTLFMLQRPGLLPNPNSDDTEQVRYGRRLFNSPSTACASCHRPPGFMRAFVFHPAPWVFGPVITPNRSPRGKNLDLVEKEFVEASRTQQREHVRMKATSLLGLWDRPPPLLHDGRAPSLKEAICSPDHPALSEGEVGFNEFDGLPDTHGGTSHLSPRQISALIRYMNTL